MQVFSYLFFGKTKNLTFATKPAAFSSGRAHNEPKPKFSVQGAGVEPAKNRLIFRHVYQFRHPRKILTTTRRVAHSSLCVVEVAGIEPETVARWHCSTVELHPRKTAAQTDQKERRNVNLTGSFAGNTCRRRCYNG